MILAPSHQLRLNGSSILLILALGTLLSSCELFRKAQAGEEPSPNKEELDPIPGKKVYDPETGTLVIVEETPVEVMDTIRWKNIPTDSIPPIQTQTAQVEEESGNPSELIDRGDYGTEYYTAYDISIMLPFLTDRFNPLSSEIYDNSYWALGFYGGVRMALDELNEEGIKLNVTVMDSKANERRVGSLLSTRTELFNAHMILGPYRSDNVRMVAEFAKRNNITYISPHTASSNISNNNPNYIQVSPTLQSHCKAIMRHARQNYEGNRIVLVARDKPAEKARFAYFQEENYLLEGTRNDSVRLEEYLIEDNDSGDYSSMDIAQFVSPGETVIFIVPSWSNENFIYSFLAYAKVAKGLNSNIVVYGMPQWMEYDRIDFELYESLNVHVSADTYLDYYDTDIQFFRSRFFDRYGTTPRTEAFLGYDVMKYFGKMINKHGTKFQYYMEQDPMKMLHTQFDFERVAKVGTTAIENAPIERFENKYVHILKFQNYQFQPTTE